MAGRCSKDISAQTECVIANLDQVKGKINEMCASVLAASQSDKNARIQAVADEIVNMLLRLDLAYKQHVPNKAVGVHMDNRYKVGLDPTDVHDLLLEIFRKGWSFLEVVGARGFEIPPGAKGDEYIKFNYDLVESSDGMLAPCPAHWLRIVSVACSHTVAGLRCIEFGTKGVSDELCANGVVSKERILEGCPSFAEPLAEGLKWTIIRAPVAAACPQLAAVLQEAGNAGHSTRRVNTKLQNLMQIHQKSLRCVKEGGPIWDRIAREIEVNRPNLQGQGQGMCNYVAAFSGGTDPIYLKDLDRFSKGLPVRRDISGQSFGMFAKAQLAHAPDYVTACVKASLAAPDNYVRMGESKLFCTNDVESMVKGNKAHVAEAVKIMRDAKTWASSIGIDKTAATRIIDDLEIRIVMHVHHKKAKGRKVFKSLIDIAKQFVHEVYDLDKVKAALIAAPWGLPSEEPAAAPGPSRAAPLREFSAEGLSAIGLERDGFVVGAEVRHSSGGSTFIKSIDGTRVRVGDAAADSTTVEITTAMLVDEYTVYAGKRIVKTPVGDFPNPLGHTEHKLEFRKSVMRMGLNYAFEKFYEETKVTVQTKPTRSVFTLAKYQKDKLVLVPLSPSVGVSQTKLSASVVDFGVVHTDARTSVAYRGYVSPKFDPPSDDVAPSGCDVKVAGVFVVPFWCVKKTQDSGAANMALKHERIVAKIDVGGVEGQAITIDVPVLRNTSVIAEGAELLVFEPPRQKHSDSAPVKRNAEPQAKPKAKAPKRG